MKQKLLQWSSLRALLLTVILLTGGGKFNATWAETISIGINPTSSSSTSYVTTDQEFTIGGVTFIMSNYNPKTGQIRGNQPSASDNFYLYNTTAIPGTLSSVSISATVGDAKTFIKTGNSSISTPDGSGTAASRAAWSGLSGTYFCISMAKGGTSGTVNMTGITITYESSTPAAPTFSPSAGSVVLGTLVTISGVSGSTIYYTTNGDTPTTSTLTHGTADAGSATVTIDGAMTVKAIAVKGGVASGVASATYTIAQVAAPTFSPSAGSVVYGTSLSITSETDGATIHYTTDGSTPTSSSATYSSPITLNTAQTIKAIAIKDNYLDSDVASAAYTIKSPDTPVFSTADGTAVYYGTKITISADAGASIYYTTAASSPADPTNASTPYPDGGISITSAQTIKAIAYDGAGNASSVGSASYTLQAPEAPSFNLAAGKVTIGSSLTLSAGEGTTIYYTTNGDTPTSSSTAYSSAISIIEACTVKAIAIDPAGNSSSVASRAYTVDGINLSSTGTLSFSAEDWNTTVLGSSYGNRDCTLEASDGNSYTWHANQGFYSSGGWQIKKTEGVVTSPTIISKRGFTISVKKGTNNVIISDGTSSGTNTLTTTKSSTTITIVGDGAYAVFKDITITPTKLTPTVSFTEPTTELTVDDEVTNAASSSNGKSITYTSSDETVVTVDATGKVTALKVGSTTITASVAADVDYNAASETYDLTVEGKPCATGISLILTDDSDNTLDIDDIAKDAVGTLSTTYTKADPDLTITASFSTSDDTVLDISDDAFSAEKGGTATITVTLTPDDLDHYQITTASFDATVINSIKIDNVLTLSASSGSVLYGSNVDLTATVATGYDGTLTSTVANPAIASVSIDGTAITITTQAVGATTITITCPATANYLNNIERTYTLTVLAPNSSNTADVTERVGILDEDFDSVDGSGGNSDGFASKGSGTSVTGWDLTSASAGDQCLTFGTSKLQGSATTPSLTVVSGKTYKLTFKAAPWSAETTKMTITISGGTIDGNASVTDASNISTGEWNNYEYNVLASSTSMTISFVANQNRFWLDDVHLFIPRLAPTVQATLPSSGIGTYCSEYPLTFNEETDATVKAYAVSDFDGEAGEVTLTKVHGNIAGGTPLILVGTPSTTVNLTPAASGASYSGTNMLQGTLAPTYVEQTAGLNTNFGMSGGEFNKLNTGVIPAHKAYLPLPTASFSNGVKAFTLRFVDHATGITTSRRIKAQEARIFDLSGRRVTKPTHGLYIINGKKVMIK